MSAPPSTPENAGATPTGADQAGSAAGAEPRLCGYRRCRAPLPSPTRPGRPYRFCPDDKSWGSDRLTCRAAEGAFAAVESLQPGTAVTPAVLEDLRDQLRGAAGPLHDVLTAVATAQTHLDAEVLTALADRDAALVAATTDRVTRVAAEQHAAQAQQDADTAQDQTREQRRRADEAVVAAAAAGRAAAEAQRAQDRADGRVAALEDRLRRAEDLTDAVTDQAATLRQELATAAATARAGDVALEAERARVDELRAQHQRDLADRDQRLEQLRADADAERERLRVAHTQEVDRQAGQHQETLAQLRADHERHEQRRSADHATALDTLRTELATLQAKFEETRIRLAAASPPTEQDASGAGTPPARPATTP